MDYSGEPGNKKKDNPSPVKEGSVIYESISEEVSYT